MKNLEKGKTDEDELFTYIKWDGEWESLGVIINYFSLPWVKIHDNKIIEFLFGEDVVVAVNMNECICKFEDGAMFIADIEDITSNKE